MSTTVIEEEWFSAGLRDRWGKTKYVGKEPYSEILVRAWEPGDGLTCSASPYNHHFPCGSPVAVVRTVTLANKVYDKWERRATNRVVCIRHLARQFDEEACPLADAEVEKQALEELAQRYWDQYQEIRTRVTQELLDKRFAALPNGLRERAIQAMKEQAS